MGVGVWFVHGFWAKGLSVSSMFIVKKDVKQCQLTVHSQKLEKSGIKLLKLRLMKGLLQAPKTVADATMKNVLFCSGNPGKTGCKF